MILSYALFPVKTFPNSDEKTVKQKQKQQQQQ